MDNTRNGDLRRSNRAKYWATLIICKGQILKVPSQIILELRKREQEFEEVNKTTTDCQFDLLFNKSKTITSLRLIIKARFPNSPPCRLNRLCRFKFLEATGTIIWKRSSDHSGRSLRQKLSGVRDRVEFYPCDRDDRKRLSSDRIF